MISKGHQPNFWISYLIEESLTDPCHVLQISIRSAWANRQINIEIRTSNITCSDLTVVWRMTWEESNHGMYTSKSLRYKSECPSEVKQEDATNAWSYSLAEV